MEPLLLGLAIAGGAGLSGLAVWAAWRSTRTPASEEPVEMELVPSPRPARIAARPVPVTAAPPPARAAPPAPASPRSHAQRAPAMVLTQGVAMQDSEFSRAAMRAPAAPAQPERRAPPPPKTWAQQTRESAAPEVQTEWARRQVGPVEPGRVAGACGGCGARLSVSAARPLRIACPVCGRSKLVA